jgi:hypothetical protein
LFRWDSREPGGKTRHTASATRGVGLRQSSGLQRKGGGAVFDERGHLFGASEIRLMDDARLTVDARALDDVVVELLAFLLGDERGHIGVIPLYTEIGLTFAASAPWRENSG